MAALLNNNVDWVPLMVKYLFLNDDDVTHPCYIPRTVNENLQSNPTLVLKHNKTHLNSD